MEEDTFRRSSEVVVTSEEKKSMDSRLFWIGLCILILLLCFPWLLFLSLLGLVLGFCSLEFINQRLRPFILGRLRRKISEDRNYDPLLHPTHDSASSSSCTVCNLSDCHRGYRTKPHLKSSLSGSIFHQDLKLDSRLDAAVARFFTAVFDVYVSPVWAPYETRLELKRVLVKTLLAFGLGVKETFFSSEEDTKAFVHRKVVPLFLSHLNTIQVGIHVSAAEEEEAHRRVMELTKLLLLKFLSPEDAECHLWTELCLSVLGDGVFWNLILLGRDEIPLLVAEQLKSIKTENQKGKGDTQVTPLHGPVSFSAEKERKMVSLLVESFLDPTLDVEQPSTIFSRHRPSLACVLRESDLLYSFIQFLRGEGALEWLQAVLDQEPAVPNSRTNARSFPRKIIEIKHLNHFSRSRIFLENLGFSRIEPAIEVDPDLQPINTKSSSHHMRSSSYGGRSGSSSGGVWEQKVVEGLPIYPLLDQSLPAISSQSTSLSPPVEPESLFRRRHTLEPFITKFYLSLHHAKETDMGEEGSTVGIGKLRVGIQPKETRTDSLGRHVILHNEDKDILETLMRTGISLMRKDSGWKGIFVGWVGFLRPLLKEKIEELIDVGTGKALSLENILTFLQLITDAFITSQGSEKKEIRTEVPAREHVGGKDGSLRAIDWLLESLFDKEDLLRNLASNRDGILLFFVDLLDTLVSSLIKPSTDN